MSPSFSIPLQIYSIPMFQAIRSILFSIKSSPSSPNKQTLTLKADTLTTKTSPLNTQQVSTEL